MSLQGVSMKMCSDRWKEEREEENANVHGSAEEIGFLADGRRRAHSDLYLVVRSLARRI